MLLFRQLFRYIVVGGLSTIVDFAIYMLLSIYLSVVLSKVLSFIAASLPYYIISKNWIFKSSPASRSSNVAKFYLVLLVNFLANVSFNYIAFELSGEKIFSFVIATACAIPVNFLLQRYWVFNPISK